VRWLPLAALLLGACELTEVLVAFDPDGGRGDACDDRHPCPADAYCEKTVCHATSGRCQRKPQLPCDTNSLPVCGCDDVSYLNDCWRRSSGESFRALGECAFPTSCDDAHPCPGASVCARLTSSCAAGAGVCWVAPETCPTAQAFLDCADAGVCLDACAAIATQRPFRRAPGAACP
jgi:hypothetical protein